MPPEPNPTQPDESGGAAPEPELELPPYEPDHDAIDVSVREADRPNPSGSK